MQGASVGLQPFCVLSAFCIAQGVREIPAKRIGVVVNALPDRGFIALIQVLFPPSVFFKGRFCFMVAIPFLHCFSLVNHCCKVLGVIERALALEFCFAPLKFNVGHFRQGAGENASFVGVI